MAFTGQETGLNQLQPWSLDFSGWNLESFSTLEPVPLLKGGALLRELLGKDE
jgi:hypothetical protein